MKYTLILNTQIDEISSSRKAVISHTAVIVGASIQVTCPEVCNSFEDLRASSMGAWTSDGLQLLDLKTRGPFY